MMAEIGKTALLAFIAVAILIIVANYIRRRRSGIRPWRPPNSRIIGYDAVIPQIEQPPGSPYTDGQLLPHDPPVPEEPPRNHRGESA